MYFIEIKRPPPPATAVDLIERLSKRREKWWTLLMNMYMRQDNTPILLIESYIKNSPQISKIDFFRSLIA
jgi:hypothetical protein